MIRKHARNAEIEHFRAPIASDEDIRGLEISMDDTVRVRVANRESDLLEHVDHCRDEVTRSCIARSHITRCCMR